MGLISGSFSFKTFAVSGQHPPVPEDRLLEPLVNHAFDPSSPIADASQMGFITCEHLLDTDLTPAKCFAGEFLYFQFRQDQNKVPGDLLKSYVRLEEAAARQASGKNALTHDERQLAKESALARAQEEARRGVFRKIKAYPALFDLAHDRLLFAGTGSGPSDDFAGFFESAFGLAVETLSAGALATRIAEDAGLLRALSDVRPTHFISPPGDHLAAGVGAKTQRNEKDFLGTEFLTWLCWKVRQDSATVDLPGRGVKQASVMFDKVLEMVCAYDLTGKDTIRCDGPANAPETASALAVGKQIRKAGLMLAVGGEEYTLTLDGANWTVGGLKLPDPQEENDDPLARRLERFEGFRGVMNVLERLLAVFVKLRLSGEWPATSGQIKKWIAAGAK